MSDPATTTPLDDAQGLYRAGRFNEAAALFRRRLQSEPQNLEALKALGVIYFQTGQFELAQYFAGEALRLAPSYFDALRIRGMSLMQLGRAEPALACFEQALALKPDFAEIIGNRATLLLSMKRVQEALAGFDRVVALDPDNAIAWNNRGNALLTLKRYEDAVQSYDRALAIQPDLDPAKQNRFLVLLQLRRVDRIADFALRGMFDEVATRFDELMVGGEINYRGHLHLRSFADAELPGLKAPLRILDLGCGTGLVGDAFKDLAAGGRLDGIDLAPLMIEEARKRSIYDELVLDDLETVLAAPGTTYDLILSADTMVYLGDLAPTFRGAANRLVAGGYYLFACESKDGSGWEQTPVSRFRHSEAYLREEAERSGLMFRARTDCTLRYEKKEPVPGFTIALQKPL